nr:protein terminal ear1 homolog [Ipomoea batatas]
MATLNPAAPVYTPLCHATFHSYAIHHCYYPTSPLSTYHNRLLPFPNFFPVTPYYYTQLQLLPPPPLPALSPPCMAPAPVTSATTSVTHKLFDAAGPSLPPPRTSVVGFDHGRNSEPVTRPGENKKANNVVSAYDFLYLPMDFKAVWRFFHAFHDKTSVFLESSNSVMVVAAKGKEAQVKRFESTIFNCESEAFLPVWFSPARDGSGRAVKNMTVGKCGRKTIVPCSLGN